MKPSQVAVTLRRIASTLEASKKPNKSLVAQDLNLLINRMAGNRTAGDLSAALKDLDELFDELSKKANKGGGLDPSGGGDPYAKGVIEELVGPILETANFLREVAKSDKAVNPNKMKSSWNKAIDNLGYQEAEKE